MNEPGPNPTPWYVSTERVVLKGFLYLTMLGAMFDKSPYDRGKVTTPMAVSVAALAILVHLPPRGSRDAR